jgi:hypothetical protein
MIRFVASPSFHTFDHALPLQGALTSQRAQALPFQLRAAPRHLLRVVRGTPATELPHIWIRFPLKLWIRIGMRVGCPRPSRKPRRYSPSARGRMVSPTRAI